MWDNFMSSADNVDSSASGDNSMHYTLPEVMDGLALMTSYTPTATGRAGASTAYAATYTGFDGLTVSYGVGEDKNVVASEADATSMSASYAYDSVTVSYTELEYDDKVNTGDREVTSFNVAYTVSDAISISYGEEEVSDGAASTVDAEFAGIEVAYTSGGMTVTANMQEAENISYGTGAEEDKDYYRGIYINFNSEGSRVKIWRDDDVYSKAYKGDESSFRTGQEYYNESTDRRPLVARHPVDGTEYFYPMFIYMYKAYYEDGTEIENFDKFKDKLYNIITRSKYMFHHVFREGDLLFMDQLLTSHRRSAVKNKDRELWRTAFDYSKTVENYTPVVFK